MKTYSIALALSTMLLLGSPVFGQQPTGKPEIPGGEGGVIVTHSPDGAGSVPGGPAAGDANSETPSGPVPATANSITEAQALMLLRSAGYTDVTGLVKDKDSIWRGKALKEGKTVGLALDSRARIFSE